MLTPKLYDPEKSISVGDVLVTLPSYDQNACQKQLKEGKFSEMSVPGP